MYYIYGLKSAFWVGKVQTNKHLARGISRVKSHLSTIRGCDVQICEWRKRDRVGVVERVMGGQRLDELVLSHEQVCERRFRITIWIWI